MLSLRHACFHHLGRLTGLTVLFFGVTFSQRQGVAEELALFENQLWNQSSAGLEPRGGGCVRFA